MAKGYLFACTVRRATLSIPRLRSDDGDERTTWSAAHVRRLLQWPWSDSRRQCGARRRVCLSDANLDQRATLAAMDPRGSYRTPVMSPEDTQLEWERRLLERKIHEHRDERQGEDREANVGGDVPATPEVAEAGWGMHWAHRQPSGPSSGRAPMWASISRRASFRGMRCAGKDCAVSRLAGPATAKEPTTAPV